MTSDDQVFWTFFITTMCGFLLALGRQMYKSKCKEIKCLCLHIVRDVESEENVDEAHLQMRQKPSPSNTDEFQFSNINV